MNEDKIDIHNYTLLIYRDILIIDNKAVVDGNITSYKFEDENLFTYPYTFVIFGNNYLGKGYCSNKTFFYHKSWFR